MDTKKENKIKKFIKEIFHQSFYKDGKFHPPYLYMWLMLSLVPLSLCLRFFKIADLSDTLILGLCANILGWLAYFKIGDIKK